MTSTAAQSFTKPNRWILALAIACLVGFVPGTVIAWRQHADAQAAERNVSVLLLRDHAAMSSLYARRGDYEKSRAAASIMFDSMRMRIDEQAGTEGERNALRQLLTERDKTITLLARSDPASVDLLQSIHYQLSQVLPASPE